MRFFVGVFSYEYRCKRQQPNLLVLDQDTNSFLHDFVSTIRMLTLGKEAYCVLDISQL